MFQATAEFFHQTPIFDNIQNLEFRIVLKIVKVILLHQRALWRYDRIDVEIWKILFKDSSFPKVIWNLLLKTKFMC